jgi:hypothetical protein
MKVRFFRLFGRFRGKMALNQGKLHKIGVGTAENAAPALFLYPKKPKSLVYFCSFYAAARNEEKVRTERFEPTKSLLDKIASF